VPCVALGSTDSIITFSYMFGAAIAGVANSAGGRCYHYEWVGLFYGFPTFRMKVYVFLLQLFPRGCSRFSKTIRPHTICYAAEINACAYCENDHLVKQDSLRVAVQTYKDLEKSSYGNTNHVTYATLLSALCNLLSPFKMSFALLYGLRAVLNVTVLYTK
jgi:hypothetical protein